MKPLDRVSSFVAVILLLLSPQSTSAADKPAPAAFQRWAVLASPELRDSGLSDLLTANLSSTEYRPRRTRTACRDHERDRTVEGAQPGRFVAAIEIRATDESGCARAAVVGRTRQEEVREAGYQRLSVVNCRQLSELRLLETSVTQAGVSKLAWRPLGFQYYFDRDE